MSCTSRQPSFSSSPFATSAASPDADDEVEALRRENAQLRDALVSRAAIEQAKGMLMLGYGLRADQAFAVLVRWSQAHQVKVRDLAKRLTQEPDTRLSGNAPSDEADSATATTSGGARPRARPRPPAVVPLESLMGG